MHSRKLEFAFLVCYSDARFQKHITGRGWRGFWVDEVWIGGRNSAISIPVSVYWMYRMPARCGMIYLSVEPIFINVLPRYLKSRTCSMRWLSHLRCIGESVTDIIVWYLSIRFWTIPVHRTSKRARSVQYPSIVLQKELKGYKNLFLGYALVVVDKGIDPRLFVYVSFANWFFSTAHSCCRVLGGGRKPPAQPSSFTQACDWLLKK